MTHETTDQISRAVRQDRKARVWLGLSAAVGLLVYLPTFYSLGQSGLKTDSYYAHWFLIPLVSGLFIWLKRDKLRELYAAGEPIQGARVGLLLMIGSLMLHVFAVWFRIDFVSAFAFVGTVWGFALYVFGRRIVREIAFPLFYLLFMVPLPQFVINPLAFHMKVFSAKMALLIYGIFGGTAILAGPNIELAGGETLWMGYECSGLRSLVTMGALGAAFAYLVRTSIAKKMLLFLISLPLAVLSNGLRVTSLCFASARWGTGSKAFKVFHDASSPAVFLLMLAGLFGVQKLLTIGAQEKPVTPGSEDSREDGAAAQRRHPPLRPFGVTKRLTVTLVLLSVSAIAVFLSSHAFSLTQWMSSLRPVELPEHLGSWRMTSVEVSGSEGVYAMLNTKSIVIGTYQNPEGIEAKVMVVASDTHRDAFHPPEICMMGGGNYIVRSWREPVNIPDTAGTTTDKKNLRVNAFVMRDAQEAETLVLYWFMVGEKSMGNRLLQQIMLMLNGARSTPVTGAMIRVTVPLWITSADEALRSAKDLVACLVPEMPRILNTAKPHPPSPGAIPSKSFP